MLIESIIVSVVTAVILNFASAFWKSVTADYILVYPKPSRIKHKRMRELKRYFNICLTVIIFHLWQYIRNFDNSAKVPMIIILLITLFVLQGCFAEMVDYAAGQENRSTDNSTNKPD